MTQLDPQKRITIDQVKRHPWLVDMPSMDAFNVKVEITKRIFDVNKVLKLILSQPKIE